MKLRDSIELNAKAAELPYTISDNSNPLMTVHIKHVAEEAKALKDSGENIAMTDDGKKYQGGYKTILYHGLAGPTKQTVVITSKDGQKKSFVSKLG